MRRNRYAIPALTLDGETFRVARQEFERAAGAFIGGISDGKGREYAGQYREYLLHVSLGLAYRRKPLPNTPSPTLTLIRNELDRLFYESFRR